MISISFLLAIAFACTKSVDATVPATDISSSGVNKAIILQLVNDARKRGCQCGDAYYPPAASVTWNDQLEKAALDHSNDMLENSYFSHTNKKGNSAGIRIKEAGYRWSIYGENIAHGYSTEKAVVEGWLSSSGHCSNIMSRLFTEMGVAKAGSYWTQDFATK